MASDSDSDVDEDYDTFDGVIPIRRSGRRTATFMVDHDSKDQLKRSLRMKQRSQRALEHAKNVVAGGSFSENAPPPGLGRYSGSRDQNRSRSGPRRGAARAGRRRGAAPAPSLCGSSRCRLAASLKSATAKVVGSASPSPQGTASPSSASVAPEDDQSVGSGERRRRQRRPLPQLRPPATSELVGFVSSAKKKLDDKVQAEEGHRSGRRRPRPRPRRPRRWASTARRRRPRRGGAAAPSARPPGYTAGPAKKRDSINRFAQLREHVTGPEDPEARARANSTTIMSAADFAHLVSQHMDKESDTAKSLEGATHKATEKFKAFRKHAAPKGPLVVGGGLDASKVSGAGAVRRAARNVGQEDVAQFNRALAKAVKTGGSPTGSSRGVKAGNDGVAGVDRRGSVVAKIKTIKESASDSSDSDADSEGRGDADSDEEPTRLEPWRRTMWFLTAFLNFGMNDPCVDDAVAKMGVKTSPLKAPPTIRGHHAREVEHGDGASVATAATTGSTALVGDRDSAATRATTESASSESDGDSSESEGDEDDLGQREVVLRHCVAKVARQDRVQGLRLEECFVTRVVRAASHRAAPPPGKPSLAPGAFPHLLRRDPSAPPHVRQVRCTHFAGATHGHSPRIELPHTPVGDGAARALSNVVARTRPEALVLDDNNLGDRAAAACVDALRGCDKLSEIAISRNKLGPTTASMLAALADVPDIRKSMRILVLEHCGLGDRSLAVALEGWRFAMLTRLNLSANAIAEGAAQGLAQIIANGNLVDLDVRDTKLRGPAAKVVAAALGSKYSRVATLDLSWNGFHDEPGGPRAGGRGPLGELARALEHTATLTHVDLSHNNLAAADLRTLGDALKHNFTVMGLHLEGQEARVDALGFVVGVRDDARPRRRGDPPAPRGARRGRGSSGQRPGIAAAGTDRAAAGHNVFSRILTPGSRVVGGDRWKASGCCWICDRWVEHRFVWSPGESDAGATLASDSVVRLRASFDGWEPKAMHAVGNQGERRAGPVRPKLELWRMVPPGASQYCFAVGESPATLHTYALDQAAEPRDRAAAAGVPKIVNATALAPRPLAEEIKLLPRSDNAKPKPVAWTVARSAFSAYKADTDVVLDGAFLCAFDADYRLTGLEKLLAKAAANDDGLVEDMKTELRNEFATIKNTFKHYACQSSEMFTMGWNSWNVFVKLLCAGEGDDEPPTPSPGEARTPGGGKRGGAALRRSDTDMIFFKACTIGPKGPMNPMKSLNRFQFLEAVVRLGVGRWKNDVDSPLDAVLKTLERMAAMLEDAAEQHVPRPRLRPGVEKRMSLGEWLGLANKLGLFDDGPGRARPRRGAKAAFSSARRPRGRARRQACRKLTYIEFVECLLRVADAQAKSDDGKRRGVHAARRPSARLAGGKESKLDHAQLALTAARGFGAAGDKLGLAALRGAASAATPAAASQRRPAPGRVAAAELPRQERPAPPKEVTFELRHPEPAAPRSKHGIDTRAGFAAKNAAAIFEALPRRV
ncbi:hypothetical protein SO694_00026161 [Aureococcus anophagefferens]|uniref:Uncharacterized protein n=1 Tax=Aureococcus anophagefferens TaxID=44056 RepID=A0ABR1FUI2_AURAN